jgi:hypothetical protein
MDQPPCEHDLVDKEGACADGMCPICLASEVEQLRTSNGYTAYALGKAEDEIERLRAALAKKQEPEGGSEERVARWLRGRGYVSYRTGGQVEDGSG